MRWCARASPPLTFVDVERDGADGDADHAFGVVEKLNGLGVQGKVISVLCVEDREGVPMSREHSVARWGSLTPTESATAEANSHKTNN